MLSHKQYQHILSHGMKMLGDAWTLLIISQIRTSTKRFSELEKAISGINPVTLTNRLKKMEHCGLIRRKEKEKQNVQYTLTEKGQELLPIIDLIHNFIHKHVRPEDHS